MSCITYIYLSEVFEHSQPWQGIVLPTILYSQLRLARLVFILHHYLSPFDMLTRLRWSLPLARTSTSIQPTSWLCAGVAWPLVPYVTPFIASTHVSRNSIFKVQYFSTCDILEFVFRYPHGCVPVSKLLHTINRCKWIISYRHIGLFREKRLYRVIFVIYAHNCILSDSCRTVLCRVSFTRVIPVCRTLRYICIMCECNVNHHHCSMHIQPYSHE